MHSIIISTAMALILSISLSAQDPVTQHYEKIDSNDTELAELLKTLKENPDEEAANYMVAIYHYNQGVALLENMDYEAEREELFEAQEQVMLLFAKALPYADKAHQLNPSEKKTIQMLSGIYFGMNDMEKRNAYEKLLIELDQE